MADIIKEFLDIKKLSFEEALNELETTVRQLEDGKIKLEEAISCYERGAALRAFCEEKLKKAKMKVDQIIINDNGEPQLQP